MSRIVLIGDAGCGKSALAVKFAENIFLDYYEPTDFEQFIADVPAANAGTSKLTILDTSGCQEDQEIRAAFAYKGCDAVIICFDLTEQATLDSVEEYWVPELNKHSPGTPFFILGCKRDAVCSDKQGCVCEQNCCQLNEKKLTEMVKRTGAVAYSECSAYTGEEVDDIFQFVAENTVNIRPRKNSAKKIMALLKKRSKALKRLSVRS